MADDKLNRKEIPLVGKLITSEDPVLIGSNFRQLTNMRYRTGNPEGVGGHTKINTTAIGEIKNGIHFRKERHSESHVVVESYVGSTPTIYDNQTAIPGTGDFGSAVYSPSGTDGRFSLAPDGFLVYANGAETCIWGGNESEVGSFINYDPDGTFLYDYTDQARNSDEQITLNRAAQSTTGNMLLLHLDNSVVDTSPTTPHTVTYAGAAGFTSSAKFGTFCADMNGTNAYMTIPDNADFDFSDGTFSIDAWVRPDNFTAVGTLFYQKTDIESITFTLGTAEVSAGETLTGATSTKTAIVDYVSVTSGTWAGGDAAGTIYVHTVSGAFQNEIAATATGSLTLAGDFSDHGDNYAKLYIDTNGYLNFIVYECYGTGTVIVTLQTPALTVTTWQHIELTQNSNDWYLFVNGVMRAYTSDSGRLKNYISVLYIGYDTSAFYDGRIDEYRISNVARHTSNFSVPIVAYSDDAGGTTDTWFYIGTILPASSYKFYVQTANTAAAVAAIDYWNGTTFTAVSSLVDGTAITGKSLAQTGTMSFTSPAALAKVSSIEGVLLYWSRVKITTLDDNVVLTQITAGIPFQPIKEIWDGIPANPLAFYVKTGTTYDDFTGNVRDDNYNSTDAATYANIHGLDTTADSSKGLIIGFEDRQTALKFVIVGTNANVTADTTATISYHDGTGWATVGLIDDKTSVNNISFAQGGLISWNALSDGVEFRTEFTGVPKDTESVLGTVAKSPALYFYKISFNKALAGAAESKLLLVHVTGIPAQKTISSYKFPLLAMDRLWLFSDQKSNKNKSICTSESTPTVFNGDDSHSLVWGDDSEIIAADWIYSQYGSSIYSVLVVFKKNEMWGLVGNDPSDWVQYKIASIGCLAPKTVKVINMPMDQSNGSSRSSWIVFQGANGIYITDGRPPILISQDISDLFDKRQSKINQAMIDESFGFVDRERMEYHWCFAQGSEIDTEKVFDYGRMRWFDIDRPVPLTAGIEVENTNGVTYEYGGIDGHLLRLENGNTFDGSDITHTMWFGDIPLAGEGSPTIETTAEYHNLIASTKTTTNDITVTHYGDTETTGTEFEVIPRKTGYRTIRTSAHPQVFGPHLFHSWKFELTTNDQVKGFEPLYFSCLFKVIRNYIKDYRS